MRSSLAKYLPFRLGYPLAFWSAILLVTAGVLVAVYEEQLYRAQKLQEANVQAQILAGSVTAALSFGDRATAREYVNALAANPEIEAAAVYDTLGNQFAGFMREGAEPPPPRVDLDESRIGQGRIYITVPVVMGSARLGEVHLRAALEPFGRGLARYLGIALLVVMAVLVLGVSAASQRALSRANRALAVQARELADSNELLQREIEERAKAEEALRQSQKMEAIGQLSGGIAHDFNNLLSVIKGNLQLLQRRMTQGRRDVERYVDAAMEAVNRSATLTQRILAFSRRQPLSPRALNLNQLLESMRDLIRHSVGEQIQIDMRLNADWLVLCDANQMENVILNLAINARDAMPDGGTLVIETGNRPQAVVEGLGPGDFVALRVRDSGTGMSEDIRQRAADPFFTTKPQGKGTGLGLSMALGYVQQSEGDLEIESKLGEGTTVTILLPRHIPVHAAASA